MSVWFITGTSSGIGAALAAQVLADGNSVIGTFRSAAQATAFDGAAPGRSFGMVADVCDDDAVRAAVADGTAKAGAPEVVVNAAGYGLVGAVEEVDERVARHEALTAALQALDGSLAPANSRLTAARTADDALTELRDRLSQARAIAATVAATSTSSALADTQRSQLVADCARRTETLVALQAQRAEARRAVAEGGQQPCSLCAHPFTPSISNPDTCARCSK